MKIQITMINLHGERIAIEASPDLTIGELCKESLQVLDGNKTSPCYRSYIELRLELPFPELKVPIIKPDPNVEAPPNVLVSEGYEPPPEVTPSKIVKESELPIKHLCPKCKTPLTYSIPEYEEIFYFCSDCNAAILPSDVLIKGEKE